MITRTTTQEELGFHLQEAVFGQLEHAKVHIGGWIEASTADENHGLSFILLLWSESTGELFGGQWHFDDSGS